MSDMNFICPTCKRPTHPTDNEMIEYRVKEKDKYRDILGERTKELYHTRKALDVAVDTLKGIDWCAQDYAKAQETLNKITALEQKDIK